LTQFHDLQQEIDELEDTLSSQVFFESQLGEETIPEQLTQFHDLQQEIDELEDVLYIQLNPSSNETVTKQFSKVKSEKKVEKLEFIDIENEIIPILQKLNDKLDDIKKKIYGLFATIL